MAASQARRLWRSSWLPGCGFLRVLWVCPDLSCPLAQECWQDPAGRVRIEVGQGVDQQAVSAVRIGHDDRLIYLSHLRAHGQGRAEERRAEAQALGGVVVARREHHLRAVREAVEGVIEQPNGVRGRDGAVIHVPGDDDGVD